LPFARRFRPDPARRAEADATERSRKRIKRRNAPRSSCRKEFEPVEAEVEPAHDVGGRRHPRQERNGGVPGGQGERVGEARRDDEAAAGIDCLRQLHLIEHRSGSDDRAGHLSHLVDRIECQGRAESHFEHWQSSGDERLGKFRPVPLLVEHQDRDDRRRAHDLVDGHECSLANAAAAPNRPGSG
jgi:ribosome assembly protein YihI (activator of Der GTPase)